MGSCGRGRQVSYKKEKEENGTLHTVCSRRMCNDLGAVDGYYKIRLNLLVRKLFPDILKILFRSTLRPWATWELQLQGPRTATEHPGACTLPHRSCRNKKPTPQLETSPPSPQLEKAHTATENQHSQKHTNRISKREAIV